MIDIVFSCLVGWCEKIIYSYWWYIIPVLIGFVFRYSLLAYRVLSPKEKSKKILINILVIAVLTFMCNTIKENNVVLTFVLLLAYCYYAFFEKHNGGETDNLIQIINDFFLVLLSFAPTFVIMTISWIVIVISSLIYKKLDTFEIKSDFWSIVLTCLEILASSIYMYIFSIESIIGIFFVVLFFETAVFTLNIVLMYVIKKYFKEDVDYYWRELCDMRDM